MDLKQQAAAKAVEYVHSGMVLGLGSGSTTHFFIQMLGRLVQTGQLVGLRAVPTSKETAAQMNDLGIPLTSLAESPLLDLAVDGADEVDPQLNLIKGLGRALLREKVVEIHARRFVVIVDESKLVAQLGRGPLPVEIVPFEFEAHLRWLGALGCRAELWREADGSPVVTDNGNYLVRCWFADDPLRQPGIPDVFSLARQLADRPGIVEHGLFLNMAQQVIVAGAQGVRILERQA
jgi:ribose 5-phosphate isomerase A